MKKSILLLAIFATVAGNVFATTRTVSNHPNGGAQFATLAAAYNASVNGDTLLLEGTDVDYDNSSNYWFKKLTVIGIGFNPTKTVVKKTKIKGDGVDPFFLGFVGNQSSFHGIEFTSNVGNIGQLSAYSFFDCVFHNGLTIATQHDNLIFVNCIFKSSTGVGCSLFASENNQFISCIFDKGISVQNPITTVLFEQCLFLQNGFTEPPFHVTNTFNITPIRVQNSIIYNATNFSGTSIPGSVFSNNISRYSFPLPPFGASGSGNLNTTDPLFVNVPVQGSYHPTNDYHLQPGSPAIGAGTNGSDIGPHGSGTNFSETGEVLIAPIVRSLSTSVGVGGTLNINVNATVPNSN